MIKSEKVENFTMNFTMKYEITMRYQSRIKETDFKTDKQKWILEFCFYKMIYRKEKCVFKGKLGNTKFCVVV